MDARRPRPLIREFASGDPRIPSGQDPAEELARRVAEMEPLRDAADAANRAKSQFLANGSFEIRTPLTAISRRRPPNACG